MDVTRERFEEAWNVRKTNFSDDIHFFAPTLKHYETAELSQSGSPTFMPVSITGAACQVGCKHCGATILDSMIPARDPGSLLNVAANLYEKGCKGLLVSGGAMKDGTVPFQDFLPIMRRLKEEFGFYIAVHTGLVDDRLARGFRQAGIDSAMIDIIGDDRTIREIYRIEARIDRFDASLKALSAHGIPTSPHIVLGLHYGALLGEWNAMEMISKYDNIMSLVLVAFTPIRGTEMEKVIPLEPERLADFFVETRLRFPALQILLGCARPLGDHQVVTDGYALEAGLNGIAYPAEGIVAKAEQMGLHPRYSEFCCSLIFHYV